MASRYLTSEDIAEEYACSRSRAYEIIKTIPHIVDGRMVRVSRIAWEAYLKRLEQPGTEPCQNSTSAGTSGIAVTGTRRGTGSVSRRSARTAQPRNSSPTDASAIQPIRDTQPRTRRRSNPLSTD